MGGTSTDVALINGEIQLTTEGVVADFPVAVPMVDMHTIGAGGGSIAYLDAGGLLQVGPRSAGADPGPACYAKGGSAATVTDANVVLGRIPAAAVLGGDLRIDVDKAVSALRTLATPLGLEVAEVARGIIDIANEHMTRALRVISVERGVDPRDYVLLSFGGAGGLHVCALAQAMGMRGAIVPVHAGVLSAFGMLVAPWSRNFSRTLNGLLEEFELAVLDQYFADLYQQGRIALGADGVDEADICVQYSLDVRYRGQSTTLQVPWQGKEQTSAAFHALHQQRYGHALSMPVELVNLRVQVTAEMPAVQLPALGQAASADAPILQQARLQGIQELVNLYERECLLVGHRIVGPALIVERCATTYLAPNWQCEIDAIGNLRLCYGD